MEFKQRDSETPKPSKKLLKKKKQKVDHRKTVPGTKQEGKVL